MNRTHPNRKQQQILPELVRHRIENTPHAARFFYYISQILVLPMYEKNSQGTPAYDRPTMVALILYAMFHSKYSAQAIHKFAKDNLGAIWILGEIALPSKKTLKRIIDEILEHIESIFGQVLSLCEQLNLIGNDTMYIDGTKIKANASKHKAMSYKYLLTKTHAAEEEIAELIQGIVAAIDGLSERSDEALEKLILMEAKEVHQNEKRKKQEDLRQKEIEVFGGDTQEPNQPPSFHSTLVDSVPEEEQQQVETTLDAIGFKAERLSTMEQSKKLLETQWKEEQGEKPIPDDEQINFTDPESSIMVTKHHGVQQCYNNFALVDDHAYVVVGAFSTDTTADKLALEPTCEHAQEFVDLAGVTVGADAGFFSADNMEYAQTKEIDLFISTPEPSGRFHKVNFTYDAEQDQYRCPEGESLVPGKRVRSDAKTVGYKTEACQSCPSQSKCTSANDGMRTIRRHKKKDPLREEAREKANSPQGRDVLRMRKGVAEPVWGNLLLQGGFDQHHYRGLDKAGREFKLRCVMHNLHKIFKAFAHSQQNRSRIEEYAAPPRVA